MEEKQLDIREIQRVLKRRWKLIFIITIILTSFTGLMSYFVITPQYASSTKLFIGKAKSVDEKYSANDVQIYQKLLKTYSELIQTNDLISKAIDKYNVNASVGMVLDGLSVEPKTDTQILDISFKSSDPVLSKEVLEAVTKEFVFEAEDLIPDATVTVKIIQASNLPNYPVSPDIPKNILLGLIVGFVLGIALAFWLEFINNTFKSKEQLEEIMGIPVIGLIPIQVKKSPKSVVAEAYRTLRTNVQYSAFDKEIKTILVTSSDVKEGKSTICGNIALSFSKNEKKVILIDCDLRKPSLHKMFNVSNVKGLSEVLVESEELNEAIKKYSNNLDILTSGTIPLNQSDVLGSKAMSELLEVLKNKYDTIILDSSPIRVVTDAQILATKVDATILVVKRDTTNIEALKDSKNLLNKVGANIIGSILNGMDSPRMKDRCYYNNEEIIIKA